MSAACTSKDCMARGGRLSIQRNTRVLTAMSPSVINGRAARGAVSMKGNKGLLLKAGALPCIAGRGVAAGLPFPPGGKGPVRCRAEDRSLGGGFLRRPLSQKSPTVLGQEDATLYNVPTDASLRSCRRPPSRSFMPCSLNPDK